MNITTLIGEISNGTITTTRISGLTDQIPIRTTENGRYKVIGELHTHNTPDRHLKLYVTPTELHKIPSGVQSDNTITISGYVCKTPTRRTTPGGRIITDYLIASPRDNSQSDYIPCIGWGNNIPQYPIGTAVQITGRIQSREYLKNNQTKTTYEVSITTIGVDEKQ